MNIFTYLDVLVYMMQFLTSQSIHLVGGWSQINSVRAGCFDFMKQLKATTNLIVIKYIVITILMLIVTFVIKLHTFKIIIDSFDLF